MAKKRNKLKNNVIQRKLVLRSHIRKLCLNNEASYLRWCEQHGFRVTLNKSDMNLRHELRHYYEHTAFSSLKRARTRRRFADSLIAFCYDHTVLTSIRREKDPFATNACQRLLQRIRTAKGRAAAGHFLTIVNERSDLLSRGSNQNEVSYVSGLIAVASYHELWVRPIDNWHPRTHNTERQFFSLVNHVLAQYPMPAFFYSVWLHDSSFHRRCQRWFVQIAFGQNPRLGEAPVEMTAKMAHYFMQAPSSSSIIQAVRFGQIMALGGDDLLFKAIRQTRLGNNLMNNDFWLSVIRFFIAHPFLDRNQIGPICDYLQNQKFDGQVVYVDDYQERRLPPAQPNLSMKGRTPESLMTQVERWHRALGKGSGIEKLSWAPSSIKPMTLVTGKDDKTVVWIISELLSHKALAREGSAMEHCVVTYARSCLSKNCSIWSMTCESANGLLQRRQTIEVRKGTIVQCRGFMNAQPKPRELQILERWAYESQLTIDL